MSTIYKRQGDGVWVGVVDMPKGIDGKRKRKTFYVDNEKSDTKAKKILESKIRELEYQLENNIYRNPGNATIKDLISEYNENNNDIAVTTKAVNKMYETVHICASEGGIGNVRIKDALPVIFEKFYYEKMTGDRKLSPNTIIKFHSFLHGVFRFAVKNKMILINPIDSVKCPKKIKYKPRIPTDDEFIKLLDTSIGTFDEVAIVLAGVVSLCRGEIFGLKWSDIDWINQRITIEETYVNFNKYIRKEPKADARKRTVYVPKFVLDILEKYRKSLNINSKYVCTEYLPGSYSKHFKKLVDKHGLEGITLHKLRHYNAVIMMKLGVPDKVAAGRTGHSQVSTLQEVYQHVTEDADKIACEKINQFFVN